MHDLLEQSRQLRIQAQQIREEMRLARYESWVVCEKSRCFREQLQQKEAYRFTRTNIYQKSE